MALRLVGTRQSKITLTCDEVDMINRVGRSDVLLYLINRYLKGEYRVTYDDIGRACGFKNRSGAFKVVQKLKRMGILKEHKGCLIITIGEFDIV